jgi:coenzyme F420-reducing hydrogenase delta subunit/ferredoxin
MPFEPKIIAFLCTWCSYTGADTAGIARLKSPANVRAIRVPCSGRVSPELIMRAFDQGADGVLVLGCHLGECHYDTSNHRAAKRLPVLQTLLALVGLEPQRLRLDWVSASEGERFAHLTTEFAETVRALGPLHWRHPCPPAGAPVLHLAPPPPVAPTAAADWAAAAQTLGQQAAELLRSGQVSCVIGYELGPRGLTRPAFVYTPEQAVRLVWNPACTHNLTLYLADKLAPVKGQPPPKPVAVVVKPCDSRTLNVLLAENRFRRDQVYAIGLACPGLLDLQGHLQSCCAACTERTPLVYDTLIGTPPSPAELAPIPDPRLARLQALPPAERLDFWLGQFDRCLRCYACRQACPLCACPTCLYERDDSLWVGLGLGLDEKRTFHLGRAYHLAGRCIGCNACERVCPVGLPLSLLNQALAQAVAQAFEFRAGLAPVPSPIVTVLAGEYQAG